MLRAATILTALCVAAPASAHKLKVFATAIGADISGYGYFAPGGRAQDSDVTVTTDGKVVATLRTSSEGEFAFTAKSRTDHIFSVDAGDGHVATYRIAADELPETLGAGGVAQTPLAGTQQRPQILPLGPTPMSAAEIRAMVEQGVAHQLRPLREQIDAWQEKLWLHDILGGIGYIVGLAGLAFWLSANRKLKSAGPAIREARR